MVSLGSSKSLVVTERARERHRWTGRPIPALLASILISISGCAGESSGGGSGFPDLIVTEVSGTSSSPIPSGNPVAYAISVKVVNQTGLITTPFRVGLYLSGDTTIDPATDALLEGKVLSALQVGETVTLDFLGEFGPLTPGMYRVGAYADDDFAAGGLGSVIETDEGNNVALDPNPLEVFFSTPPAPQTFLAKDTALFSPGPGDWLTEGAIRLMWDAVPEAHGYNLYRATSPISQPDPLDRVNSTLIPGPAAGSGWNIQAFIDGTSQTNAGATVIPTNDAGIIPPGIYYYKVYCVDGIGTLSLDGPEVLADHAAVDTVPANVLSGSPGALPPGWELLTTLSPTFGWSVATAPERWAFSIGEPLAGVDPAWVYLDLSSGLLDIVLDYGAVGGFTARDAVPLRGGTLYSWRVVGYDANGWGIIQSSPFFILTP